MLQGVSGYCHRVVTVSHGSACCTCARSRVPVSNVPESVYGPYTKEGCCGPLVGLVGLDAGRYSLDVPGNQGRPTLYCRCTAYQRVGWCAAVTLVEPFLRCDESNYRRTYVVYHGLANQIWLGIGPGKIPTRNASWPVRLSLVPSCIRIGPVQPRLRALPEFCR